MDAAIAATFAVASPLYVRATDLSWQVVRSADGSIESEHGSILAALDAAAKPLAAKPPMLRSDSGSPDGAWRYLPAAAEELEPNAQDGVRLNERNVWQLAAGLNVRSQAIPIDGGPGSVVHGTAHDSSTPANGWAHHGIVGYDSRGLAQLYLRSEIIPDVATMIDRGTLAYGSISFWTGELDDSGSPGETGLLSYALTNTPADQRITPASAVRAHARQVVRTRQLQRATPLATERSMGTISKKDILAALDEIKGTDVDMDQLATVIAGKIAAAGKPKDAPPPDVSKEQKPVEPPASPPPERAARGAAFDLLTQIAPKLGLTADDALGDEAGYCNKLGERLWKIIDAAKLEQILESIPPGGGAVPPARSETPPPAAPPVEKRAIAGLEDPAALETWASSMLDLARKVLGKPDADPAAVLAEMQAVAEKLAAAMGAAPSAPENGTPAEQQAAGEARARLDAAVTRARTALGRKDGDAESLLTDATAKLERADHERKLNKAIAERKLAVTDADREEYLNDAAAHGWALVERHLAKLARPASGTLMRSTLPSNVGVPDPETFSEAVDCMMEEAAKRCPAGSPRHIIRAQAQKLAKKQWPAFDEDAQADATA